MAPNDEAQSRAQALQPSIPVAHVADERLVHRAKHLVQQVAFGWEVAEYQTFDDTDAAGDFADGCPLEALLEEHLAGGSEDFAETSLPALGQLRTGVDRVGISHLDFLFHGGGAKRVLRRSAYPV